MKRWIALAASLLLALVTGCSTSSAPEDGFIRNAITKVETNDIRGLGLKNFIVTKSWVDEADPKEGELEYYNVEFTADLYLKDPWLEVILDMAKTYKGGPDPSLIMAANILSNESWKKRFDESVAKCDPCRKFLSSTDNANSLILFVGAWRFLEERGFSQEVASVKTSGWYRFAKTENGWQPDF